MLEILVVDDDPLTTTVLKKFLTRVGYQVSVAKNGVIALKKLNRDPNRFKLIILDQLMPIMSGMDLLHKLLINPTIAKAPIIMLTNKAERSDKSAAYTAGIFDYLIKPIDVTLLLIVVKRALAHYAK